MADDTSIDLLRQLAQAVHRRVDELEALLDLLPVGVAIAEDPECRHIRVNRAYARTLGISTEQNASLSAPDDERAPIRLLQDGRDLDPATLPMQRAAREGVQVRQFEMDVLRADGVLVSLSMDALPLFDDKGNVRGAVGTAFEISDRLRVEREQRFLAEVGRVLASSLDYELTMDALASVAVPILGDYCFVDVLHEDGTVARVACAATPEDKHDIARALLRFPPVLHTDSPAAAVMRSGEPLLCPECDDAIVLRAAQNDEHEHLLRVFGVHAYIMAPLRARGRTLGLLTVGTLSPVRPLGRRDLQLATDVASRAALALDNALLYRHAQDANRLKDDFLATLSHELRTPLNALLGWAQILKSQTPDGVPSRRAVDSIERNAQAQVVLINDLLDVSRVISGKLRLIQQPVDIAGIVTAAVDSVRPAARAREIDLGVWIAPMRLEVTGDPDRLQQVVWNLLSNAVKFTPPGGRVDVTVEQPGGAVQVAVRDTGVGIEPALLPFVFDRFRQGDSSTTRAQGGLGLGLAIVRHLVDLHGGSVTVESEGPNRGSRFIVTLPASSPRPMTVPQAVAPRARGGVLRGLRVVTVDDDPDARELMLLVLEAAGAEVVAVGGVEDALRAIDRARPDVIVADIAMPGLDGYDLLREIQRRHEPGALPPVIAVSAYAAMEDAQRALAAGFARHLGKPVEHGTLVTAIAECAAGTRPRG